MEQKNKKTIYKDEILSSCLSSKNRVIKTIGIIFIPFIYAFICICAFWNPFAKINKIPTAVVSLDNTQLCLKDQIIPSELLNYKEVVIGYSNSSSLSDWTGIQTDLPLTNDDIQTWVSNHPNVYFYSQVDKDLIDEGQTANGISITNNKLIYSSFVDELMNAWKNNEFKNVGFSYDKNSYYLTIKNIGKVKIDYVTGNDANKIAKYNMVNDTWSSEYSKYYMHIDIPQNFTSSIVNTLQATSQITTIAAAEKYLSNMKINDFVDYSKNYLCGEILETSSKVMNQLIINQVFTSIVNPFIYVDVFTSNTTNVDFTKYGVGIGQLFMCVGMWVGGFAMLRLFNRKRNAYTLCKKNRCKWFFERLKPMITISTIQGFVLMMALGMIGFFGLGWVFLIQLLLIIFIGWIFSTIICGLTFLTEDDDRLSLILIIFLVFNIACGWGTFPAFMQNSFFWFLSHILPFTYIIHAQGAIIFGLGGNFAILHNILYILEMCGIVLIFAFVFFGIGILSISKQRRKIYYGVSSKKKLLIALKNCEMNEYIDNNKILFKKLPKEKNDKLITYCEQNFPETKKFKWYEKKYE